MRLKDRRIGQRKAWKVTDMNEEYIVSHFDDALENGYIQPFFQPIYRSITEKICAVEALARWNDPQFGLLSPAVFIPALENHGLIYELDMSVVRQTCAFYRRLQDAGLPVHTFTVNLSRHDFNEPDLFERVNASVQEFRMPPHFLKLEITEGIMLEDVETFKRVFNLFHRAGFSIWIDDFGSGYSSLNMLQSYDFSTLKFDMMFLRNYSEKSRQVLASMVHMAKALRIHTLAEGVETEDQKLFLRSLGCEALQGFYYCAPLSGDRFIDYLRGNPGISETVDDYGYWDKIGLFNFLSTAPLNDFHEYDNTCELQSPSRYHRTAPLALLEVSQGSAFYVYVSEAYLDRIHTLGYPSIDALEHAFNDRVSDQFLMMKRLAANAISNMTIQEVDYINNDVYYRLWARCLAKEESRAMLALQLRTFEAEKEVRTAEEMLRFGSALFNTYELVTVIYPEKDSSERIYSRENIPSYASAGRLRDSFRRFCENEVHPDDRKRYFELCNLDTLEERMEQGFVQGNFRLVSSGKWRAIRISRIPSDTEHTFLYTIQALHDQEEDILNTFVREHPDRM